MAKTITRIFQNLFGTTDLGSSRVAQFGSLKAGTPAFASSASQIQTTQFNEGWVEAVIGQNYPAIEDRNALDYLLFYQLAYLFQQGVPEYDSSTTYYQGSLVASSGVLYVCFNDNSGAGISGQPVTNATYWDLAAPRSGNSLLNSAFDWWQRGIAPIDVPNTFGANAFTYSADRWAALNSMGPGGSPVLQMSQAAGSLSGSVYALQSKVTTAPTGTGNFQVLQILDVTESQKYAGKNAVFQVQVKALGNLNKVSVGFVYATTDLGVAANLNPIGTPTDYTVNTAGYVACSIPATAIGSVLGTGGVLGVSITAAGNSNSGGIYAVNDGFVLEQAQMNVGSVLAPYARAYADSGVELDALCRYYETSLVVNGGSGTVSTSSGWQGDATSGHVYNSPVCRYRAQKRVSVSPTLTDSGSALNFPSTPNVNTHDQQGYSSTRTANATGAGEYYESFTCDAEIY